MEGHGCSSDLYNNFFGELIGTFIIVLFGCSSVAVSVLFSSNIGLFQVAVVWGFGVALAIYVTRHLSCAHLNPAVSFAMVLSGRMPFRKLLNYLLAQFLGAFGAAAVVYCLFFCSISRFEKLNGLVRGDPGSVKTAMIFGNFYPNPGAGAFASVSTANAFAAEMLGTGLLVFIILALTHDCNVGRPDNNFVPLFIGMTVIAIICVIAPLTQAGLNPARDLAPRLFSWLAGWGDVAFPDRSYGYLTVYVVGPIMGGAAASLIERSLLARAYRQRQELCEAGADAVCSLKAESSSPCAAGCKDWKAASAESYLRRIAQVKK